MPSIDKNFTSHFKATVALAALKGDKTDVELEQEFAVSCVNINKWKQHLLKNSNVLFEYDDHNIVNINANHAKIGEIIAENDFLTKILGR